MRLRHLGGTILVVALSVTLAAAQAVTIARAYADGSGAVHIVAANGQDIAVPKEKEQTGAEEFKTSNDHQTVGWFVVYPNPDPNRAWEKLYGELILWRDGKVLRRFSTEVVFWSWGFWQDGKQIAFHIGPLHGAGRSELHPSRQAALSLRSMTTTPRLNLIGRSHWTLEFSERTLMRRGSRICSVWGISL